MGNMRFLGALVASIVAFSSAIPTAQAADSVNFGSDQAAASDESTPEAFLFGEFGEMERKVEVIPNANGLRFELHKDDQLKVVDERVIVANGEGKALVELDPDLPDGMTLWMDEEKGEVFAVQEGPAFRGCTDNKWVKWGIQTAWDGLVCVPATIATAPGVVTGAATAAGCHAAGGALTTAASC